MRGFRRRYEESPDLGRHGVLVESTASVPATPAWTQRPANLAKAVTAELVQRIVRGQQPPESLLPPEPALCEAFSVSRTVIREAVKILQEKGLVQIRQGAGTIVLPSTAWNMLDGLVLAAALEEDHSLAILDDLVVTRRLLESDMAHVAARLAPRTSSTSCRCWSTGWTSS